MIKKFILCVSMLLVAQWSLGQNIDKLFSEFSHAPKVENVKINKFLMTLIKPFMNGDDTRGLKGINSMQILALSSCSSDIKNSFAEKVKTINDESYETLVRSNQNGENVRILVKIDKEEIRELVILTTGEGAALVKIKGKFKKSDLARLTDK
jgi:hypothetical protein